jgi:hypothetical protein
MGAVYVNNVGSDGQRWAGQPFFYVNNVGWNGLGGVILFNTVGYDGLSP